MLLAREDGRIFLLSFLTHICCAIPCRAAASLGHVRPCTLPRLFLALLVLLATLRQKHRVPAYLLRNTMWVPSYKSLAQAKSHFAALLLNHGKRRHCVMPFPPQFVREALLRKGEIARVELLRTARYRGKPNTKQSDCWVFLPPHDFFSRQFERKSVNYFASSDRFAILRIFRNLTRR